MAKKWIYIFYHNMQCKINMKYELNTRLFNNWKTRECIVNSNCILYNKRYTPSKKVSRCYFEIIIIKTTNAFLYEDNGCFRVSFVYRSYTSFAVVYSPNNGAFNYREVCTNNCVVNGRRIFVRKILKNKLQKSFYVQHYL